MDQLKSFVETYFSWIFKIGLVMVILSTLFLFTNLTTEFYDTPKFILLIVFIGILLILTTLKYTLTNKVVLVRTPLDIPLLLLLTVGIVSTILSPSPYVSLLGNQLRVNGSLAAIIVLVIFYFILVNNLKGVKSVKWILDITTLASAILSVVTLIAYMGVKLLPSPWTHGINFTPTGSSFSTTAVLALLIPFVVTQIMNGKFTTQILNTVFLTIFGITIALTGSIPTWIAAIFGFGLTLILSPLRQIRHISQVNPINLVGLAIPLIAVILVTVLSTVPPVGGNQNPLYNQAKTFAALKEAQLPFVPSWKISVSAFRDAPFWGTGPATYLFDFTTYKPIEYNQIKALWNLRFDSSFNEYMSILATLGGVGLLALLSLTALFISSAFSVLLSSHEDDGTQRMKKALALSGFVLFILLALHSSTMVVWIIGLFILASFMVLNLSETSKTWGSASSPKQILSRIVSFSTRDSSEDTIRIDALPSILLTGSIALVLFGFFYGAKFTLADYHHRLALNAVAQNQGLVAYNELVIAEKLNPVNDLYRTDLAQTNFALANAIASAKAPTEASPQGSLSDQDKQNIQVLLQQSINEGRIATTLSPRSAVNWEILALLYRQISGVAQNALVFSLDSYGKAIFQDPLNPLLRLNVGGTYYAIKNYDLAIRFFTDSINLKSDFANGYYNLSVAYRDKGDLTTALAAAEKVVELIEDKNSADYKVATDYLKDLKNKITPPTPAAPPAAQTSGALQEETLPKVVDVGTPPEKITTPPAIKKSSAATPEPASPRGEPTPTPIP